MLQINVYSLPPFVEVGEIKNSAAVVIDVLRATTVTVCAVAAGAKDVIPMLDIEQAWQRKAALEKTLGPNSVILGGERHGLPISGFDLGNSPQLYTPEKVAGKILILTTTNGTVAMYAARQAKSIYAAALVNAQAVVERLKDEDRIAIICAGTDGTITEEDRLLAGCLVSRLARQRPLIQRNEEAKAVQQLWEDHFLLGNEESISIPSLIKLLRQSRGGCNLIQLKLDTDIVTAAKIDSINIVPEIKISEALPPRL